MKLPGVISLRKLLPIWSDAEQAACAGCRHHVGKGDEDALRGLGAQIVQPLLGLDGPEMGLEHHVEFARLGPLPLGATIGQTISVIGTESGFSIPFFAA